MKRILLASAAAVAIAAPAFAADLPAAPIYTKAPAYVAPYSWTGFYIGGNIGYSWGRSATTQTLNDATTGAALATSTSTFDLDGVIGGGQIGYNVQTGNWVWGIEADLQASGQSGGKNLVCPGATGAAGPGTCAIGFFSTFLPAIPGGAVTDALSQKLTWLDTVRGRVGVTVTPTILAYVTGGLAVGNVSTTDTISGTNALAGGAPVVASFNSSSTRAGWTIGGGLETALGGRWTGKIEYIYVDLGTVSGGPFVTPLVAPSGNFLSGSFSSHVTDNILRAGVNYRF